MLVFDAHLDLSWNALQWNRDLRLSAYTIRTRESGMPEKGRAQNTVALPEMRKGQVFLCFSTLLARSTRHECRPCRFQYGGAGVWRGARPARLLSGVGAAWRYSHSQVDLMTLNQHVDRCGKSRIPMSNQPPLGFVISMESADSILQPDDLEDWYQAGVRLIGPAHYGMGRYAGGTGCR